MIEMVNIDFVNELSDVIVEQKVDEYRDKLKKKQADLRETRTKRINAALAAKELAHQMLTEVLKEVKDLIQNALKQQENHIFFNCGTQMKGLYTASLLMQVLPLQGFLCVTNNSNNTVKISW